MYLLAKWLIAALALLLASALVPGITISSLYVALVVALVLGFLNAIVRPVLILLTLPINILTLGLFTLVLNGLIFWFVASFVQGFEVHGFFTAIVGALFVSVVSWAGNQLLKGHHSGSHQKKSESFYHVDKIVKPD
ncbi:MAG TPA: phage holin family protein [Candidatus Paceibacterota bacterium]|nr:phage holin family protein [Candidatus Paceibacterota bacterium]